MKSSPQKKDVLDLRIMQYARPSKSVYSVPNQYKL